MADEADFEVVVEVPRGSRNKYEYDFDRNVVVFDRRVIGAVAFPADYGFIPGTHAPDGDHMDALVLLDEATYPGVHVPARVVGAVMIRSGDLEPEPKIICVAVGDPTYGNVRTMAELPDYVVGEIEQFFRVYKNLREGPSPEIVGRHDADQTRQLIEQSR